MATQIRLWGKDRDTKEVKFLEVIGELTGDKKFDNAVLDLAEHTLIQRRAMAKIKTNPNYRWKYRLIKREVSDEWDWADEYDPTRSS